MDDDGIESAEEFFAVLSEALGITEQLLGETPGLETFELIKAQLQAMVEFTANGRAPTAEEKERVQVGLIAVREFDPADDEVIYEYSDKLQALNYFFDLWPSA